MFKVLTDWKGSPDGFTVIQYKAGQKVDLHPTLVAVALAEKWVEEVPASSVYEQASRNWVGESIAQAPIKVSRRKHKR